MKTFTELIGEEESERKDSRKITYVNRLEYIVFSGCRWNEDRKKYVSVCSVKRLKGDNLLFHLSADDAQTKEQTKKKLESKITMAGVLADYHSKCANVYVSFICILFNFFFIILQRSSFSAFVHETSIHSPCCILDLRLYGLMFVHLWNGNQNNINTEL